MNTDHHWRRPPLWTYCVILIALAAVAVAGATGGFIRFTAPANAAAGGWIRTADFAPTLGDSTEPVRLAYDAAGQPHRILPGQPAVYEWYDGSQWQRVNAPGAGPLTIADDGTVHLVYVANGDIRHSRFVNGAWTKPVVVASTNGDSVNPAIALDNQGRPQVAWEDFSLGRPEVLFSSFNGSSWSRTVNLSASPDRNSAHPQVAVGGDDRIHVVWQEEDAGGSECYDICVATWDGSWSAPEPVVNWAGDQEEPSLVIDSSDRPIVAFCDYALGGIYVTQREGSSWAAPRLVDIDRAGGQAPTIAIAADGTLHMTWTRQARTAWWPFGRPQAQVFYRTIKGDDLSVPVSLSRDVKISGTTRPQIALTPNGQPGVTFTALSASGGLTAAFAQRPTAAEPTNPVTILWLVTGVLVLLALVGLLLELRTRAASTGAHSGAPWYRTPVALATAITLCAGIIVNVGVGLGRRVISYPVTKRPAGWTAPTAVSRGPGDASAPRLAIDAQGKVHLVWAGTVGTTKRIYYRDLASDEIQTIDAVTTGGSDSPDIAVADDGLHVTWESWSPTPEIMIGEKSGTEWSDPQTAFASSSFAGQQQVQVAQNPLVAGSERPQLVSGRGTGLLDLIWTFGTRDRGDIVASSAVSGQWQALTNISANIGVSDQASATALDGKLHVVWSDNTLDETIGQNRSDVLYRVFDGQTWSDIRNISVNATQSTDPTVVAEKSGRISFVWVDSGGSGSRWRTFIDSLSSDRPEGAPPSVMYRRMEHGRLSRPRSIDVPVPLDYPQMPGSVAVAAAADDQGRLHVVWSRFTGSEYRLYYRRLDKLRWSRIYLLDVSDKVSEPFTFQTVEPDIAVDQDGGVHVVWPEYRAGRFDITYLRCSPTSGK